MVPRRVRGNSSCGPEGTDRSEMPARTWTRTLLPGLALVALLTGIVLSRAVPGLPEHVSLAAQEPEIPDGPGGEPAAPANKPDTPEQPETPEKPETAPEEEKERASSFFPELKGDELRAALKAAAEAGHQPLSYRKAREAMYWIIDNRNGTVTTVYALKPLRLKPGEWPRQQDLNCEHVWPQSKGSRGMPMKTDLFHLRPARPRVNSTRSNYPFGVPREDDDPATPWHVGRDAEGNMVFMPPDSHRGDISRSMFYFAVRYDKAIKENEEEVLRRWHKDDPVDERERQRADFIQQEQGNRNPFIDDPEIVDRIEDF